MITAAQVDAEQELASLCGLLNASYARLVAIVAQSLQDESWAIAGVHSPEHWLMMRAGLSPFHARQVVAVSRRRSQLPTVMDQFADGQLSLDQVTVVARYAPSHVEESVAEFAVNASVPQLRRALSRYSFDPPTPDTTGEQISTGKADDTSEQISIGETDDTSGPDDVDQADDTDRVGDTGDPARAGETTPDQNPPCWDGLALIENRASAPAELSISHDQYGRFTLRFSAPADLGALVEAALKEAKDALFKAGRPEVTMGDAMVEMAQRSLGAVVSINRRNAYRSYVHLDTEGGWLTGKPRLPMHIAEKLTCDGILQPVWHTRGAPVNVGRAQRIVPPRTRRLVEDRDRGCRFPGCASTRVECHHLIHWVDGGPTDTWNLAALCSFHHDGDFTITGNADDPHGLTFTSRSGYPIKPGPTFTTPPDPPTPTPIPTPAAAASAPEAGSPAPAPAPAPQAIRYRGPTGQSLDLGWVTFSEPQEPAFL
jgi:hypothetical protein